MLIQVSTWSCNWLFIYFKIVTGFQCEMYSKFDLSNWTLCSHFRARNIRQPLALAIFQPVFPIRPSKSSLLGQIYCTFPMRKPLIVNSNIPAFEEWPTNFELFQALPFAGNQWEMASDSPLLYILHSIIACCIICITPHLVFPVMDSYDIKCICCHGEILTI